MEGPSNQLLNGIGLSEMYIFATKIAEIKEILIFYNKIFKTF
jgi:hypothetical protein